MRDDCLVIYHFPLRPPFPFLTNGAVLKSEAGDFGRICISWTSRTSEYLTTLKESVGPRGILPTLKLIPADGVCEKATRCVTPRGPAISIKSLSLFLRRS